MRKTFISLLITLPIVMADPFAEAQGAGTLRPKGSPDQPVSIVDHHVDVVLNNGFARTAVTQTFFNPNPRDLEAIYSFPLPKSASLSEVTIFAGEKEIHGEVIEKDKARTVHEEERDQGNDTGLAEKNEFKTFEFFVSPVRANDQTRIRFVYYQPIEIDTGVGRYVYPLRDGGTDEAAEAFWARNEQVEQSFSIDVELKSGWPVDQLRLPGFDQDARIDQKGDGHYKVHVERQAFALSQDFVLYYRLQEGLPGRVELVPYKPDADQPGTFMMVVTPGIDLAPISGEQGGADYTFVLDVSGSMSAKLHSLARGISRALADMRAGDRFRIITFNNGARDLTGGYKPVTGESVRAGIHLVESLRSNGGTNLFKGLRLALDDLQADRATSIVLLTDGVTNLGPTNGKAFRELMRQHDIRVFGFVMGNSGNWPLMRTICEASGGFAAGVSVDDDIVGQIMLATSKITAECLHDVELKISGVKTFNVSDELLGKVYRGQQLVIFGRYDDGGTADVRLQARLTGEDRTYNTTFDFPDVDTDNPEIERLYALNAIERLQIREDAGLLDPAETENAIRDLGVQYQLVTDHTSMLVLSDQDFQRHGIERRNQQRVAREHAAQRVRMTEAPRNRRVDQNQPMFRRDAPSTGNGAFGPIEIALVLLLLGVATRTLRS